MSDRKVLHRYTYQEFESVLFEDQVHFERDPETQTLYVTFDIPEKKNALNLAGWSFIAKLFNETPKYVATRTRTELEWANSTVLGPDVPAAIAALRKQDGPDLHVIGSGDLTQTLMKHDLVDEYALMFFPVVLGTGKRLFAGGTVPTTMKLVESTITPTGTIIARYQPAGAVRYGSFGIDG